MAYYLYSNESLPNPNLHGKPGYAPEILEAGYATLPPIKEGEWISFSDLFARTAGSKEHAAMFRSNGNGFYTMRHRDWKDRAGTKEFVDYADLAEIVKARWGQRGVIVIDHAPSDTEKTQLVAKSKAANLAFRMKAVEEYEERIKQKAVGEKVSTRVTPYEDECYSILGLTKPYSVEAMRAQRHPGEAVGEQIVAALERLEKRKQEEKVPAVPPPIEGKGYTIHPAK